MYGAAVPATGFYIDGGYAYFFDAVTGLVKIMFSPRGASDTVVAKGSAAYSAIYRTIQGLRPVTQTQLDALMKPTRASAPTPSAAAAPAAGQAVVQAAEAATPFYKKEWFPPAAVLGIVVLLGGVLILRKN